MELQGTEKDLTKKIAEEEDRTRQIEEQKLAAERSYQHARGDLEACRERCGELDRDLTARRSRLELLQQLLASWNGDMPVEMEARDGLVDGPLSQLLAFFRCATLMLISR